MTAEIEKEIPIPPDARGRPSKYPFGELEPGDSFWVSEPRERIAPAASQYGKRHSAKLATRSGVEDGITGTRVWRVE